MNIFFNASLSGKREFGDSYEAIISQLKTLGYNLVSPLLRKRSAEDVSQESADKALLFYKQLRAQIAKSQICIFEVSHPSTGIGHEITLALSLNKPVIALHLPERLPSILDAIPDEELQVIDYYPESLNRILKEAINIASEQMDTRFNFFISRKLAMYLDWVANKRRIPRAVYLRQLILREMSKYRDFY